MKPAQAYATLGGRSREEVQERRLALRVLAACYMNRGDRSYNPRDLAKLVKTGMVEFVRGADREYLIPSEDTSSRITAASDAVYANSSAFNTANWPREREASTPLRTMVVYNNIPEDLAEVKRSDPHEVVELYSEISELREQGWLAEDAKGLCVSDDAWQCIIRVITEDWDNTKNPAAVTF